ANIPEDHPAAQPSIGLAADGDSWPLRQALADRRLLMVGDAGARFGPLPGGPWPEPATQAVILPLTERGGSDPAGWVVAGVNPRRPLNAQYRQFFQLLGAHIESAVNNAHAYDEERRRAESLAEYDRAKTEHFENISHEFRTPLTLMLGPLDEAIGKAPAEWREPLKMARRNAQRLLRMVNLLLDFARIEAGRLEARYEPTDLSTYTADLASNFRSAIESAGLRYIVDCAPLPESVDVDRVMWEKIVFNLISNAYNHTREGEVAVRLKSADGEVVLTVSDTGVGISETDLPHIYERFFRGADVSARVQEGIGIGLPLVRELVRLHGGDIAATSKRGEGSTFTVSIPFGRAHRRWARPAEAAVPMTEAVAYIGGIPPPPQPAPPVAVAGNRDGRPRIIVADDNADMRAYLFRLLAPHYEVETANDGAAALDAVNRERPDLVLSDVMMPAMNGFELLQAIKGDPVLRPIPVILLTARAGEHETVGALEAGADEYLVKPFSAAELLARIRSQLELADSRKQLERASRAKDEFLAMLGHELRNPLSPIATALQLMRLRAPDVLIREREIIENQVRQLGALVDDLLDVSRIARGKIELKKEQVDVAQVIAQALETAGPLLEQREQSVQTDIGDGLIVEGDSRRLVQIVSNLLTNAAKYSPPRRTVHVGAAREGKQVVIRVRDEGIGIGRDLLPRVFELFTQDRRALDRAEGGLGLGLAIVRSLTRLHGGSVDAYSAGRNRGAEFVVRLPLLEPGPSQRSKKPPEPATAAGDRGRLKVLVVDDYRDAAESLAQVLEFEGYRTRVAGDGPEALEAAAEFRPAVALVDLGLPIMDGYELARRLQQTPGLENLRLIAVTGYGQESDRQRTREAGFVEHLVKPIDAGTVGDLVARIAAA
ncbi:MAG TPA: ATP-binding protein, partial [Gammaproteobacteria bacterium]|nr:ATP-binding protein [Gammaproteobacteria bacterium]